MTIIPTIALLVALTPVGRSFADEDQVISEPVVSSEPFYRGAIRPSGPVVGLHSRKPLPPRQLIEVSPTIDRAFVLSILGVMVSSEVMGPLIQATMVWPQPADDGAKEYAARKSH